MMYIENSPLEDNLKYILRRDSTAHVASATATATDTSLARVQVAEEANTTGGRAGTALPPDLVEITSKNLGVAELSPEPLIKRKLSGEQLDYQIFESPPQIAANEEEDPETEKFELFDVVDVLPDSNVRKEKVLNSQQLAENTEEFIIRFEDQTQSEEAQKEFKYIIVPNKKAKSVPPPLQSIQEYIFKQNTATESYLPRALPALRPIPDAIPLQAAYNTKKQTTNNNFSRVFNGQRFRYSDQPHLNQPNSYIHYNGYHSENFIDNEGEDEEEYESGLGTAEDSVTDFRIETTPMGIDIISKLKRLLHLNTNSDQNGSEGKRKRRTEYKAADSSYPKHFKYRKVESKFPKYISAPLDNDDYNFVKPNPQQELILEKSLHKRTGNQPLELNQNHPMDKSKLRKTMFASPTHSYIKNTNYADLEFSDDDDEPQMIKEYTIDTNMVGTSGAAASPSRRFFNIPISHRAEERTKFSNAFGFKPSSAPTTASLMDATRTNSSILASSLVNEYLRRPTTYAEAVRQNRSPLTATGNIIGVGDDRASSICSSAASTSTSARLGNSWNCPSSWFSNPRSIVTLEKETKEREKYQQLLEQMVPRIYTGENSPQNFSLNPNALRRRSALLLAGTTTSTARNSPSFMASGRKSLLQKSDKSLLHSLKRPPLSSTINLDDDDVEYGDVTITGISHISNKNINGPLTASVIIDDDDIIDLDHEDELDPDELKIVSACSKLKENDEDVTFIGISKLKKQQERELPYVKPVNSLQDQLSASKVYQNDWMPNFQSKWNQRKLNRQTEVLEIAKEAEKVSAERRAIELELNERLRSVGLVDTNYVVIDDFFEPIVEEEPEFIQLNADQQARIKASVCGPPDQILVSKFNLNITRRDIHTLLGHNWLNDEVINFYMNLLTERGEKKSQSHGYPQVYAMNTFFVPRLLQAGHGGVKRWTRKIDIFSKDVIPVPVHVGGVHWCMAIIHIKNKTIRYYDSMGSPNPNVLKALEQYLKDESMDKRKQPFDTSQFEIESVRDVPRQMNGSDCGVFSCMFAEYISRNRDITFSQQNMEYFRHKMILEIVQGELLH